MKVAITSSGFNLDASVETRLGRARGFAVVEMDSGDFQYLDNSKAGGAGQGAGIQAARLMAAHGVRVVLTGHLRPNAIRALQAAGIRVCTGLTGGSIRKAIEEFKAGAAQEASRADVRGHW